MPALRNRDSVPDFAKLHWAGQLARHVRNAEGLRAILCGYFHVPIHIEQFAGHWLLLPETERSQLGRSGSALGPGCRHRSASLRSSEQDPYPHRAAVSRAVRKLSAGRGASAQAGGLDSLLSGIRVRAGMCSWFWSAAEVPATQLGASQRLGWSTWLGARKSDEDADDLALDAEAMLKRFEQRL